MNDITHANTNIETWLINYDKTRKDGLKITSHDCKHSGLRLSWMTLAKVSSWYFKISSSQHYSVFHQLRNVTWTHEKRLQEANFHTTTYNYIIFVLRCLNGNSQKLCQMEFTECFYKTIHTKAKFDLIYHNTMNTVNNYSMQDLHSTTILAHQLWIKLLQNDRGKILCPALHKNW